MKNTTITISLVCIIVAAISIYFFNLNRIYDKYDLIENIKLVENYALQSDWDQAERISVQIKKVWDIHKNLVIFNFGEENISFFEHTLNSIIAGAKAKDISLILSNIITARENLENINKLVPEP